MAAFYVPGSHQKENLCRQEPGKDPPGLQATKRQGHSCEHAHSVDATCKNGPKVVDIN
jgi:hypothetical protein